VERLDYAQDRGDARAPDVRPRDPVADAATPDGGVVADRAGALRRLQQQAGNRATLHAVSRAPGAYGVQRLVNPLDFSVLVKSNRATSRRMVLPTIYRVRALQYARFNPTDGAIILAALARQPAFHAGGWILDVQTGASAMTLGSDVFVRNGLLKPSTYIHELVHVHQYAQRGGMPFLVEYFEGSAHEVIGRLARREPLNMMTASPLENEAYAVGARFNEWLKTH
jgi:hypothetical protein